MARVTTVRQVPASAGRFIVDLGKGAVTDIAHVTLPRLPAGKSEAAGPLLLRRHASADRQFHDWWASARTDKPDVRTVSVTILAPDLKALFTWRFLGARPVALSYGELDGASIAPLDEVLELAFDRIERDPPEKPLTPR